MIAKVIVDITHSNVDKIFEYIIPENVPLKKGMRVVVPFGPRFIEGFVVDITENSEYDYNKLKQISRVLDKEPLLSDTAFKIVQFVREKYHALYSEVLRLMIPAEMRGGRVKEIEKTKVYLTGIEYGVAVSQIKKNATNQMDLLDAVYSGESDYTELASSYGYQALKALEKKGIIFFEKEQVNRVPYEFVEGVREDFTLTEDQKRAIDVISSKEKDVNLIHGVTGCGKTEIYLRLIENELKNGKTAIFLVPEIALTPQMVGHLRARFADLVAIIHSGLSAGERFDEWNRLKKGEAKIVVGARSAIFAPLENVGVIIVDEEHETSYYSETSPRYSTIEVAKFRAILTNAKVVLGSATPSVESYYKAKSGEYGLVEIDKRINKMVMPAFEIVDMKREVKKGSRSLLSTALKEEIGQALNNKNQVILFLNRRGFSAYYQCLDCGYVCKCNTCDVSLTYHKDERALKCHYCGTKYQVPVSCPECGGKHFKLGGVGTEKVVEEVQKEYPNAKILRMDNDTTSTKEAHNAILSQFKEGKADILVGTQMVAKGHDFPAVVLVGIIDADQSMYFSDYRSLERTFQLITQVAGRAGRDKLPGKVVLQTYSPRHYILNFATHYNYKGFFDYEISVRQATAFPPFATVLRIMIVSEVEQKAKQSARTLYNKVLDLKKKEEDAFAYLNGMKSPIKKIENKFRFQIIARIVGEKQEEIIQSLYKIVDENKLVGVHSYLEVNPTNVY